MNKDNASQYLVFVKALTKGKVIQERINGVWTDMEEVLFRRSPEYYRVKPESEKMYVATWFDRDGNKRWSNPCVDKGYLERSFWGAINLKIHELDCGEAP